MSLQEELHQIHEASNCKHRLKELHDELEYQLLEFNKSGTFPSYNRLLEEMEKAKKCLRLHGYDYK